MQRLIVYGSMVCSQTRMGCIGIAWQGSVGRGSSCGPVALEVMGIKSTLTWHPVKCSRHYLSRVRALPFIHIDSGNVTKKGIQSRQVRAVQLMQSGRAAAPRHGGKPADGTKRAKEKREGACMAAPHAKLLKLPTSPALSTAS